MSLDLNYDYLDRVRRVAALYTKRKTSDLRRLQFHAAWAQS